MVVVFRSLAVCRAGSCTAAMFLQEFVHANTKEWAHLDIAGVMHASATDGHDVKGMTGRPVRTLLEYVQHGMTQ